MHIYIYMGFRKMVMITLYVHSHNFHEFSCLATGSHSPSHAFEEKKKKSMKFDSNGGSLGSFAEGLK